MHRLEVLFVFTHIVDYKKIFSNILVKFLGKILYYNQTEILIIMIKVYNYAHSVACIKKSAG